MLLRTRKPVFPCTEFCTPGICPESGRKQLVRQGCKSASGLGIVNLGYFSLLIILYKYTHTYVFMTWFGFLRRMLHFVWLSVNQYGGWFFTEQLHLPYHWNVRYCSIPEITAFAMHTFPGDEFIIFNPLRLQIVLLKLYLKMLFAYLSCWGSSNVSFIMFGESCVGQWALPLRREEMCSNF